MDDEHKEKVKSILTDWNPLGNEASNVNDLNDYETEANDILFYIDNRSSVEKINKIMIEVLSQAFGVYYNSNDTKQYAEKIKKVINDSDI